MRVQAFAANGYARTAGSLPFSVYRTRPDSNLSSGDFEDIGQLHLAVSGYAPKPELQKWAGIDAYWLKPLTIECVVRGYLVGSGWSSYQKSGQVCGIQLPAGLRQADRLPEPIFTPTTKAPKGEHDMPINDAQGAATIGADLYEKVKATSLQLYQFGHDRAKQAGMILADTKFEFGTDQSGALFLIDEVLTPDSSRFWPADQWQPGRTQPSSTVPVPQTKSRCFSGWSR